MRYFVALLVFALCAGVATAAAEPVTIGRADVALTGPWRFQPGDDTRWSAPDFDDAQWPTLDLTPLPGAHDSDVGLRDYVPGWRARGYGEHAGYAWYRLAVTISAPAGTRLALLAPAYVEDAYEVWWNGERIGGLGDFSTSPPRVFGAKPLRFDLPADAASSTAVVAIRVWMQPGAARDADAGGIHIAPRLGEAEAIALRHAWQWQQTILGYIVDAIEPFAFVLLALVAWAAARTSGEPAFHRRIAIALVLTAALRANQVVFFWFSFESAAAYEVIRYTVLGPLGLAAWILAWHAHSRRGGIVFVSLVAALTALTMAVSLVDTAPGAIRTGARAALAVLYLVAVAAQSRHALLWTLAALLIGIGQFAEELSALGVPGIWFPFGVGVSRTQYAYAGCIVLLSALLLRALVRRPAAPAGAPP